MVIGDGKREVMQKCQVPGVNVAVIKDFDIHWTKGFGTADVEAGTPDRCATSTMSMSPNLLT